MTFFPKLKKVHYSGVISFCNILIHLHTLYISVQVHSYKRKESWKWQLISLGYSSQFTLTIALGIAFSLEFLPLFGICFTDRWITQFHRICEIEKLCFEDTPNFTHIVHISVCTCNFSLPFVLLFYAVTDNKYEEKCQGRMSLNTTIAVKIRMRAQFIILCEHNCYLNKFSLNS